MKPVAAHPVPTLSPELFGSDPIPYWDNRDTAYLAALWEEPVTYVVQFAQALDSVTAGYFLSCYVARYRPGEWVALNEDIVRRETGLGGGSWYRVRHLLLDAGILANERRLNVSLYCLDGDRLEGLLRRNGDLSLCAVAGPPVSLNRLHLKTLLHYGLSVKACLLLAAVQADTPHIALAERQDCSPWVALPEQAVTERTRLSRREQRLAAEALRDIGVLETKYGGFPRMRHCRYSLQRLAELGDGYMQSLTV